MGSKAFITRDKQVNISTLLNDKTNVDSNIAKAIRIASVPLLRPNEEFKFDEECPHCISLKLLTEKTTLETPGASSDDKEIQEWILISCAAQLQNNRLSIALLSKSHKTNKCTSSYLGDLLLSIIECNNLLMFVGNMEFIWQGIDNKLYGEEVIHSIYNTDNRTIFAYFFTHAPDLNKILYKIPYKPKIKSENFFYFKLMTEIRRNGIMHHIWKNLANHKTHNLELHIGVLRLFMLQLKINKYKILQDKDYSEKKFMFMIANAEERWLVLHQIIITIQGKLPGPYISILHETFIEYLNEQLVLAIKKEIEQKRNKIRKTIEEVFMVTFSSKSFLDNFESDYNEVNFWAPFISIIWSIIFGTGFYTRSGLFKESDTIQREQNFRSIQEHKHYYTPELPYFLLCNQDVIIGIAKGTRHLAQLFDNNSLTCLQLNLSKFDKLSDSFYCIETPLIDMLPDLEIKGKSKKKFNLRHVDEFTNTTETLYRNKVAVREKCYRREFKLKQTSKLFNNDSTASLQIESIEFDENSLRSATQLRKYLLTMQIIEGLVDPLNDPKNSTFNKIIKITKSSKWKELVDYYTDCEMDTVSKLELFSLNLENFENRLKRSLKWMLIKDGLMLYKQEKSNADLFEFAEDGRLRLNGPRFKALEKHVHPFYIMLKYCKMKLGSGPKHVCKVHKDVHGIEDWKRKARYTFEKFAVECLLDKTISITESLKKNYEKRIREYENGKEEEENNDVDLMLRIDETIWNGRYK
eukprot:GAHX01001728.1.p1 GENE.GAHX01001728.1~~GAHX01001728.1.p1  ORF type:complete len:750 (+),score=154.11 GAHX01001728.1:37-2286(+)